MDIRSQASLPPDFQSNSSLLGFLKAEQFVKREFFLLEPLFLVWLLEGWRLLRPPCLRLKEGL